MKALYWFNAIRPKTLLASIGPVLIGLSISYADNSMSLAKPLVAILTLLCAVLIQIGSNISNDLFDYINGADNEKRLGPKRAAQSGLLSVRELAIGTVVVFLCSVLIGLYLFYTSLSWSIVLIGLVSIAMAVLYTGGPYPLGYYGFGDILVLIFFGIIPVQGTYLLQLGSWSQIGLAYGLLIGCAITSIIVVNNLRDIESDRDAKKFTLAVMLGKKFAIFEYIFLMCISFFGLTYFASSSSTSILYLVLLILVPIIFILIRSVINKTGSELNAVLAATSLYCFVYSIVSAIVIIFK